MSADANGDRPAVETVYLELSDGQSHKFYEATVNGTTVTIRYGRIGTAGQSSNSTYATPEKAQAEATKKINEKLRKGYVQVSSGGEEPTIVEQPTSALDSVSTVSEVCTHRFDLARLRLGIYQDRIFLGIPLQERLVAVEITAICNHPTFTINLDASANIAYHFNARSAEGRIVQNTCVAGIWGAGGEILSIPPELVSSQPFTLKIAVEQGLVIYLNDRVLTRYTHCLPPTQINAIHIVYPPENLQVQLVQVFEQTDSATKTAADPCKPQSAQPSESPSIAPEASPATVEPQTAERQSPPNLAIVTPLPPPDQRPPQEITNTPAFLKDLPSQFEPLRSFFQQNLVPYIKIQVGEQVGDMDFFNSGTGDPLTVWQSKIGGNPYFPKTAEYPIDPDTGKAMPLLMQINCADVPPIAGFDFPQVGILQFYLGFQPAEASATPGKYQVLYFPEISTDSNDLITDFSFIERDGTIQELYPEVYPIAFSASQDLFWESRYGEDIDIPEEFVELCKEFANWISDYDYERDTGIRGNKLGGYVDFHSDTNEIAERANGRLLLELIHPFSSDDSFLFFIPDEQLRDRNFSDVEFYFVCD